MEYGYSMKNNHNEYYSTVILKNVCFFSNQYFIFPLCVSYDNGNSTWREQSSSPFSHTLYELKNYRIHYENMPFFVV